MKIIFMGTPDYAVPALKQAAAEHEVIAVYTQPDKPVGRKQILTPPPVKECALELHIPVYQPRRVKRPEVVEELKAMQPDLILVAAYGQIISQEILDIPRYGCINLHASLLPKYRGASPIQRSIMNGDLLSGVTAMQMDAGIDTGDMLMKRMVPILDEDTAEDLHDKLAAAAGRMTKDILDILSTEGKIAAEPQCDDEATHAPLLTKEDGQIDWSREMRSVYNQVRGLYPWPSAYTDWDGKKLTVWKAKPTEEPSKGLQPGTAVVKGKKLYVACCDFLLEIVTLQLQGKKQMAADAFLLGNHPDGAVFGVE